MPVVRSTVRGKCPDLGGIAPLAVWFRGSGRQPWEGARNEGLSFPRGTPMIGAYFSPWNRYRQNRIRDHARFWA